MLCYACYAMILWVFVLQQQNGGNVVFFSPAEMAEEHVYLSLFPQCLWGEGATAANAVEMRPLMADTPWPRPLSPDPHLDYPSPTQTNPHLD